VGYVTTNDSFCQSNQDVTTNADEYYRPTMHARTHVLRLPALIRASVIIFVIVCKVRLSVYFSYLFICAFSSQFFFSFFCYIILAMGRQNRVRNLMNLDIKKEIISKRESGRSVGDLCAEYFYTCIFDFVSYFSCLNGCVGW